MAERKSWKGKRQAASSQEEKVDRYSAYVEATNAKILELMANNEAPWQKQWDPGQANGGMPYNATTGRGYSGYNAMALMSEQMIRGYTDNRWLTFKQAQELGCHVRRGEKGTQAIKWVEVKRKGSERGEGQQGEDDEQQNRLAPVVFTVFNGEQIEGMPAAPLRIQRAEHERHAECERLIVDSKAHIIHGGGQAYYSPHRDTVHLPEREQFHSGDAYYATALHELGHWTGHKSRLDRDLTGGFGSENYAREELRAEIASFMVGQQLGIGHDPSRHAAYLQSWIRVVQEDPKAILHACRDAEKICQFLGVEKYVYEATQKAEKTAEHTKEHARTATQATDAANDDAPGSTAAHDRQRKRVAERHAGYGMSM